VAKKTTKSNRLTSPVSEARAVPIGDYGFLSDGEVSALLAPNGSVDWMCVPRSTRRACSAPSSAGGPAPSGVAPVDVTVPADRRYLPGTMILETSWGTATGWIIGATRC
jgi:alpha,alpha-trehalase